MNRPVTPLIVAPVKAVVLGVLALNLSLLYGCAARPGADMTGLNANGAARISMQELQNELNEFAERFSGVVSAAANDIAATLPDRSVRKAALLWKLRMIPRLQDMIFGADPQPAFLDAATLTVQMRKYLQNPRGTGATLFQDAQPVAVQASLRLEEDVFDIGALFLNAQQLKTLRAEVEAFADAHPIRGTFALVEGRATSTDEVRGSQLGWVAAVPLAPFRALEGIDAGARAINDFNTTARQFSQVVEDMPLQTRWQVELLWYELEESESVTSARTSFQTLADTAATLPQDLRKQLSLALDDLEKRQDALRTTLEQTRQTLDTLNTTVGEATRLAESINRAGGSITQAGDAWRQTMLAIGDLTGSDEPADPSAESEPFDIKDYADTADRLAAAATQLRALVADVRQTLDSPQLGALSDTALRDAEQRGRSVTDHAAWRGLQLMGVAFILALAYRVISHRLAKRGETA